VLDPDEDVRYLLRISRCSNDDDVEGPIDDDRDYLDEINDRLELSGALDDEPLDESGEEPAEYDLCSDCRRKFSLEPQGSRIVQILEFSEN
jgi:hypothetical protein